MSLQFRENTKYLYTVKQCGCKMFISRNLILIFTIVICLSSLLLSVDAKKDDSKTEDELNDAFIELNFIDENDENCPHWRFMKNHNNKNGVNDLDALIFTIVNRYEAMIRHNRVTRNDVIMGDLNYRLAENGLCENIELSKVYQIFKVDDVLYTRIRGEHCRIQHNTTNGHKEDYIYCEILRSDAYLTREQMAFYNIPMDDPYPNKRDEL